VSAEWKAKRKGSAVVYTHPKLERAVVHIKYGINYGIWYNGKRFTNIEEAKEWALM
tara:strand:- start:11421 stop:11588 length:168 start_codon:yes stop_codon:yes gene_type:complete